MGSKSSSAPPTLSSVARTQACEQCRRSKPINHEPAQGRLHHPHSSLRFSGAARRVLLRCASLTVDQADVVPRFAPLLRSSMQLPSEHADSLRCTFFLSCDDHSRLCVESCAHESELTEDGRSCLLLVPSWDSAGVSPTPPYFIVYLGIHVLLTSASGHPERSGGLATASRAETSVAGEQVATSTPTQTLKSNTAEAWRQSEAQQRCSHAPNLFQEQEVGTRERAYLRKGAKERVLFFNMQY